MRCMEIKDLGDLVELVNHNSNTFARDISRLTRKARQSKTLGAILLGCVIYIFSEYKEQKKEIEKLKARVEEIENTCPVTASKGE